MRDSPPIAWPTNLFRLNRSRPSLLNVAQNRQNARPAHCTALCTWGKKSEREREGAEREGGGGRERERDWSHRAGRNPRAFIHNNAATRGRLLSTTPFRVCRYFVRRPCTPSSLSFFFSLCPSCYEPPLPSTTIDYGKFWWSLLSNEIREAQTFSLWLEVSFRRVQSLKFYWQSFGELSAELPIRLCCISSGTNNSDKLYL